MSLIKSLSNAGHYSIESLLLSEGFQKVGDSYCLKIVTDTVTISIAVDNKLMKIAYKRKGDASYIQYGSLFYHYICFFERYAMLLEIVDKLLNKDLD
ncbi:hypothetical protein DFO73_103440 [Cytobacillus oceanisediminis]|uniref:Uncharacterized protein n=1 Tax=Cytobacillus oceanisediminis TaxID=665099 RepID=A0A2V3A2S0_9BACI|nr:hypothetical protein [Cytobacillus oceanisediminis]PWW30547.1 hypothetical protein DFO73_103440 [Cytobacillus oceanisediminis]